MIRLLDCTCESPAANLALEETLLESVDAGQAPDTLRLWESSMPFVVLGTGQVLADEVHEPNCIADGVPILRRCSAGGCVLQGPGCLNYTLCLTYDAFPETRSLCASYAFVLGRLCDAFKAQALEVRRAGISDLVLDGRKVGGSAQRRKRHAFLHHGTLLHAADQVAMARYLREPKERPDYRGERRHEEFVTTLPVDVETLRDAVCRAFDASSVASVPTEAESSAARRLEEEKYSTPAWNYRR
jgi:lipoate-protein ligase A